MAVDLVVGHLKEQLPVPIAGQIDGVLGIGDATQDVGGLTKRLGGLFGKT